MTQGTDSALAEAHIHLDDLQAASDASAGPCDACVFAHRGSYHRWCRHPAIRKGHFVPETGKLVWTDQEQSQARRGLCGPEGRLFIAATKIDRVTRYIRRTWPWWIWPLLIAAEFAFFVWMAR